MIYIGSKKHSIKFLDRSFKDYGLRPKRVADLFAGTGCVARYFGNLDSTEYVLANDNMYFCFVWLKAVLGKSQGRVERGRQRTFQGFIFNNYAMQGRKYFTPENAAAIDGVRMHLRSDDYYAIAALLLAVSKVANTACTYESYLKHVKKSACKSLAIEDIPVGIRCHADITHHNIEDMDFDLYEEFDLVYLDPPHNRRKYSSNYHILETIARYDNPVLKGKTGLRNDHISCIFNHKKTCKRGFTLLLSKIKCKYIAVSYIMGGIISVPSWLEIFDMTYFGNVKMYTMPDSDEILFIAKKLSPM